jgi:hypothetical protein
MATDSEKVDLPISHFDGAETSQDERIKGASLAGPKNYSIGGTITKIADYQNRATQVTLKCGPGWYNYFYCPYDMDKTTLGIFQALLDTGLHVVITFEWPVPSGRPIVSILIQTGQPA